MQRLRHNVVSKHPERAVVIQCLYRDICRDAARLAGDTRSNGKTRPLPLIETTSQLEADGSVRSESSRQTHCGNSCFPPRLKASDATAGSECERVKSNLKRNSKPLHVNDDLTSATLITTSLKARALSIFRRLSESSRMARALLSTSQTAHVSRVDLCRHMRGSNLKE
jgi:hypothetical protein